MPHPVPDPSRWLKRSSVVALAVYWTALLVATHWPRLEPPLDMPHSDKYVHTAAYAGLALLAAGAWSLHRPLTWRAAAGLLVGLSVYGALDEITQPITSRHADVADWLADIGGTLLGMAAFLALRALAGRRR